MVVNINGLDWEVVFTSEDEYFNSEEETCLGYTAVDKLKIAVNSRLPKQIKERTLRHELTHAALFSYGFIGEDMNEELYCNFMETHAEEICQRTKEIMREVMNESSQF